MSKPKFDPNNTTVRPYFSFSQMNSYHFNKQRFLESYYYGKRQESVFLTLGKNLANALENREDPCEEYIDVIRKQIPDAPEREYKIDAILGDIPLTGILDGFFPKQLKIYEYKSGKNPSMPSWRKQMLFYSLLLYLSQKKLPKRIELFHAPTFFNENDQLVFRGNVKKYKIDIKLKDIVLFAGEVKKTWEEIKKLCQMEYQMFGVIPAYYQNKSK